MMSQPQYRHPERQSGPIASYQDDDFDRCVLVVDVMGSWQDQFTLFVQQSKIGFVITEQPSESSNSIVVLPFKNLSTDPENEYFADGITEEIIASLSKLEDLKVISRRSAFQYKGQKVDARLIGHQLSVTSILDGSLRQAGDRLRINAQLINTGDDRLLWSKRFEQEMGDIFAIQDEIADSIIEQLAVSFEPGGRRAHTSVNMRNLAAYQLYLKGMFQWNLRTEESIVAASSLFGKALEEAPEYALAHSGLSLSYRFLFSQGHSSDPENIELAKTHAQRALELDENLSEAHISMAVIYREHEWDWKLALQHSRRAMELSPNNAGARGSLSEVLRCLGEFERAVEERSKSIELDPLNVNHYTALCYTHYLGGNYHDGLKVLDQLEEVEPGYQFVQYYRGLLNIQLQEYAAAFENFNAEVVEWRKRFGLILSDARTGETGDAKASLESFIDDYGEAGAYQIGQLKIELGQHDEGFEWLTISMKKSDGGISDIKYDPLLQGVTEHPRYLAILDKLGLDDKNIAKILDSRSN